MERALRVVDEQGGERLIRGVRHPDWEDGVRICPRCGASEFRRFVAGGGRYGTREGAFVLRSDYWGTARALLVQCLRCDEELYRHPAFGLLYGANGEPAIEF